MSERRLIFMKNINWTIRIQNKNFWITIIPAALLLIQAACAIFGFTIDLSDLGQKFLGFVNAAFVVLAIIGIVNDPTTTGLTDSTRALEYDKPNDD